jgi:hypothetical protein
MPELQMLRGSQSALPRAPAPRSAARLSGIGRRAALTFRTKYQRSAAACELLRDLERRTTNAVIKEYCDLALTLISAPAHKRAAVDARVVELLAAAARRNEGK